MAPSEDVGSVPLYTLMTCRRSSVFTMIAPCKMSLGRVEVQESGKKQEGSNVEKRRVLSVTLLVEVTL